MKNKLEMYGPNEKQIHLNCSIIYFFFNFKKMVVFSMYIINKAGGLIYQRVSGIGITSVLIYSIMIIIFWNDRGNTGVHSEPMLK